MKYAPKYLLRWRFDWPLKPTKCGMWSHPGPKSDFETKAWYHNREGLSWASVEVKDVLTREVKTIVRCKGEDFKNFQWVAVATLDPKSTVKEYTPITRITALSLLTRNGDYVVFDSGEVVEKPSTTENINFKTYGV